MQNNGQVLNSGGGGGGGAKVTQAEGREGESSVLEVRVREAQL